MTKIQDELRSHIKDDRRVNGRSGRQVRKTTIGSVPTKMLATAAAEIDRLEWLIEHAENFMDDRGRKAWKDWRNGT
jgi:hypothetical protein